MAEAEEDGHDPAERRTAPNDRRYTRAEFAEYYGGFAEWAAAETTREQVSFVLRGEPAYRVFEQVRDAERVQAVLARLAR